MERPGNANYVVKGNELGKTGTTDEAEKVYLCDTITKVANETDVVTATATDKNCKYSTESQLYYVAIY